MPIWDFKINMLEFIISLHKVGFSLIFSITSIITIIIQVTQPRIFFFFLWSTGSFSVRCSLLLKIILCLANSENSAHILQFKGWDDQFCWLTAEVIFNDYPYRCLWLSLPAVHYLVDLKLSTEIHKDAKMFSMVIPPIILELMVSYYFIPYWRIFSILLTFNVFYKALFQKL